METNLGRARRRYLRARANPFPYVAGPITLDNGEIIQVPSGAEPIPAERDVPLTLPPPSDVIHNASEPYQMAPIGDTAPNVQTPKREGGPLSAPTTKKARTSRNTDDPPGAVSPNQFGAPAWNAKTLLSDDTQDDLTQAARYPPLGWPDFAQPSGGNGGVHLSHSIVDTAPCRNMSLDSSLTQQAETDPISIALAESGALIPGRKDSCMPDAWGNPEFALANSHFQVDKLPE